MAAEDDAAYRAELRRAMVRSLPGSLVGIALVVLSRVVGPRGLAEALLVIGFAFLVGTAVYSIRTAVEITKRHPRT